MKFFRILSLTVVVSALSLGRSLQAQETNEVEQLRKELREMREQMRRMEQKLERLEPKPAAVAAPATNSTEVTATETASVPVTKPWSPSDPVRVGKGGAYMDIGLVGTFAVGGSTASDIEGGTQLGGHDPNQRGFTVQGVEVNFTGAVDPFFRGNANLLFSIDSGGESFLELEEAWLETVSLPGNLQVRAGQFLTDFGRINTQHPHSWAFVDSPLVNGRLLGADGLRNPGARISWLAPTPFYSELFLAAQNSHGETAHSFRNDHEGDIFLGRPHDAGRVRSFADMLYTTRYAVSFDLTDTQTLLAGTSAAFGPNGSGADTDTQIYGADVYWKWKPANAHGGFPFVSWQTEALLRKYRAGAYSNAGDDADSSGTINGSETDVFGDGLIHNVSRGTLTDWGLYSQVLWGFKPGWVAGLRGDYVTSDTAAYEKMFGRDLDRSPRWRISPNLTWYPSEFSKLRLQYNYDDRRGTGVDHSVWLQFEFLLGAHAAHKF